MIEAYIDQIIKMDILADSITIMDEKGIIRYFKIFNKKSRPIYVYRNRRQAFSRGVH